MNSILWFRSRKVEKAYYQELTPYLKTIQNLLLAQFIIDQVIAPIGHIIFDFEEYKKKWSSAMITGGIAGLGVLGAYFVRRKLNYFLNTWFCNHPKYVTWILDWVAVGSAYFTLQSVLDIQGRSDGLTPQQSFYLGYVWFFQTFQTSFLIFNWVPRAAFFIVLLITGALRDLDLSEPKGRDGIWSMVLNCFLALAIFFTIEKSNKELFLHRESLMQKSEAWKRMVNQLPEGLTLMNKSGTVLFNNQALRALVDNETMSQSDSKRKKELLKLNDFSKFEKLTIGYCDRGLSFTNVPYDSSRTIEAAIKIDEEENKRPEQQQCLSGDLTNFLNSLLEQWKLSSKASSSSTLSASQPFAFPNDQHLILLDSQINHLGQNKSFQIKIWFTMFEDQQVLVLLFSETTQMKLVHTLQDRDAYRTRLLASVSHELRTPLNGSTNFLERLLEDERVPEDLKEGYIVPAMRSNILLLNIINDIVDFSQLQAKKLRLNFKVGNIITDLQECVKLFEIQTRLKNISLSLITPGDNFDGRFCTDHNRVKQIVLNLVSNAVKFTRAGHIRVTISEIEMEEQQQEQELEEQKLKEQEEPVRRLKISVEDTGIGIPEEEQKKLFKEYTHIENHNRSTMNPNGAGLGLMIANSLALLLGSTSSGSKGLEVTSKVDVGSTFNLILEEKVDIENNLLARLGFTPIQDEIKTGHSPLGPIDIELQNIRSHRENSLIQLIPEERNDPSDLNTIALKLQSQKINSLKDATSLLDKNSKSVTTPLIKAVTNPLIKSCTCPETLVVDDDSFNVIAIESILRSFKFKNDRAFNGKEAVLQAETRARTSCGPNCCYYKIIFMDLTMPVMNGFEATAIIKTLMKEEKIPTTYVVACTALAQVLDEKKALEAGMDEYCIKPITKAKITALFNKLDIKY